MGILEKELRKLLEVPKAHIEKLTTISDDGKSLLTRIPKEIVDFIKLKKGDKLKWLVNADTKQINLEAYHDPKKKEISD